MKSFETNDWLVLNSIIYKIYTTNDFDGMRKQFLEQIKTVIDFDSADFYLASSNAVTRDGSLVNIDGQANRVAAMIQGPKHVILVIGSQKVVDGGVNAAIARIRSQACPPNAKRLKLDTPCARTGVCNQSECGDDCMCRVTVILDHPTRGRTVTVIVTEEALGY